MSEKEPNISENGELLTEPYDNNVKMTADEDAFAVFAGQKQTALDYTLTADEVKLGLLRFQKKTIYKKNWVYTALLGVIFVLYIISIIRNPKDGLGFFLCILSLAVIAFIWLLPCNPRRKMAKTIDQMKDTFRLTICEKGLVAGTDENASYMFFENEPIDVYAYSDMLIFSICKEKIFIVPRRCVDDAAWEEAVGMLKDGLDERYHEAV